MKPINNKNATTRYTKVQAGIVAQTLVEENGNRVGLLIFNNSPETLYVKFENEATYTDFTLKIDPNGLYEMPLNYFTGKISGLWDDQTGFAMITEVGAR